MSRDKEISNDVWAIFRRVYKIGEDTPKSDKQIQLLNEIVAYLNAIQPIKQDERKTRCSKK